MLTKKLWICTSVTLILALVVGYLLIKQPAEKPWLKFSENSRFGFVLSTAKFIAIPKLVDWG